MVRLSMVLAHHRYKGRIHNNKVQHFEVSARFEVNGQLHPVDYIKFNHAHMGKKEITNAAILMQRNHWDRMQYGYRKCAITIGIRGLAEVTYEMGC